MEGEKDLHDAERPEAIVASVQGAILPNEEFSKSSSHGLTRAATTPYQLNPSTTTEDGVHDLEALEPVQTGPAYSAFSKAQKRYIVVMVTIAAFLSPTSSNIYFPALNPLKAQFHVSDTIINLTLTSYMIFQGLAPTIFGDLADMTGRRPAYIVAFVIYLGANIGLALQDSYAALFVLRCVQSTGSSGAIALGMGIVADVSSTSERGKYMGIVGAGITIGPSLGPVLGGIFVQFLGWRSIFWFLVIVAGLWLLPYVLSVPETGRNIVGNGSIPAQGWNMTLFEYLKRKKARPKTEDSQRQELASKKRKLRWPNPLKTIRIIMEKDVAIILLYNSLIYTAFYDTVATIPSLYAQIYGFNDLQIGLCYLPFGCGCCIASFLNGYMLDRNYHRIAQQIGFKIDRKRGDDLRTFPIERARLEIIWPMLTLGLAAILCYGWVLQQNTNLAAPLILTLIIGLCINGAFNILGVLLVDLYPQSPATATAANNLVRCFVGAAGTGVINLMIEGMGRGWCYTFIAGLCAAGMPCLSAVVKRGPGWREERRLRSLASREKKLRNKTSEENTHHAMVDVQIQAEAQDEKKRRETDET